MKSATPKKKRKLNVRLLRKIQKHISEEPRRFFMDDWKLKARNQEDWESKTVWLSDAPKSMPPCRTAACIAGTANLLTGGRNLAAADRAAKLLGVPPYYTGEYALKSHPLFQVSGWPLILKNRYDRAKTPKQRAKIACARIDWLIEKGE